MEEWNSYELNHITTRSNKMKFDLVLKMVAFIVFLFGYLRALSGDLETSGICFGVSGILMASYALRSKLLKEE